MISALELQHEIRQFYYVEAAMLDERRYAEWLALFTTDARYVMPARSLCYQNEADREMSGPHDVHHFDDDHRHLATRVNRLLSGLAWSEEPASRSRHLVGNVRVREAGDVTEADAAFVVHHGKGHHEQHLYTGTRHDRLRRDGSEWRISHRRIILDAVVLPSNLGVFF